MHKYYGKKRLNRCRRRSQTQRRNKNMGIDTFALRALLDYVGYKEIVHTVVRVSPGLSCMYSGKVAYTFLFIVHREFIETTTMPSTRNR